jgi:hypothetical protein
MAAIVVDSESHSVLVQTADGTQNQDRDHTCPRQENDRTGGASFMKHDLADLTKNAIDALPIIFVEEDVPFGDLIGAVALKSRCLHCTLQVSIRVVETGEVFPHRRG